MLAVVLLASFCAVGLAVPPVWYPSGSCGQSKYADAGDMDLPANYIVGGELSREHEFPWQVSVRRKSTDSHFCGGIVINDRWIMTAAHCMDGETPDIVSMVVGEHRTTDDTNTARVRHDVESIHSHVDYDSRTYQNDISMVKTVNPIVFSEDVQPVCAPDPDDLYEYRKSSVSGWGTLSSGGTCCPNTLWYVTLNITTNVYCDTVYDKDDVYDDMICATDNNGSNDRDSCQGDSGGPLTIKESDGTFRVVGVVSWGIGCASGYPGVYCRVGYFADWVTNIINSN